MAYGLWLMAYGLWLMAYGLWLMAYGLELINALVTQSPPKKGPGVQNCRARSVMGSPNNHHQFTSTLQGSISTESD